MTILNEGLNWGQVDDWVKKAFNASTAHKYHFPIGTELFKFTSYDLYPTNRQGEGTLGRPVSPWWCTVEPILGPDDLGLDGLLSAATAAGLTPSEYARRNLAVMYSWNSLSESQLGLGRIQRIRLIKPVFGFYGHTKPQRNDRYPTQSNPVPHTKGWLPGMGIQVWIPNLTSEQMIGTGWNLVG